eukprot:Rmarinus@m.25543
MSGRQFSTLKSAIKRLSHLDINCKKTPDGVLEQLKGFPVRLSFPIAWGDMDAYNHVNNVSYVRYFESARSAYMLEIARHVPWGFMADPLSGPSPILASVDVRFKFPVVYPDKLTVGARVVGVGRDYFDVRHRVVSHEHQRVAAEGDGRIVIFDYVKKQRVAVPEPLLKALETVEGELPRKDE